MHSLVPAETIEHNIFSRRGHRVMLDKSTGCHVWRRSARLDKAVKRNAARFPADLDFSLTAAEAAKLKSQL